MQLSNNTGKKYLYAIVSGPGSRDYGACGIDNSTVYCISNGEVAAVVSDVVAKKLRPERRHLSVHQNVLIRLMEEETPLPVSFGIIADDPGAIQRILANNREAFLDQLQRVAGKMEMGLRVTWDVPNIFEFFVDSHPELRSSRDRLFGTNREPSQENKIELGRMFDRMLNEDRETYTEDVEDVLSPYCFEIKRNKCRSEQEVMNLACLVGREAEDRFEEAILKAAGMFDNNFAFDYNGPWAPHNFVDLQLEIYA